jgi:prepilin-type N-terminal cleavage/methylation domain-containing protein
MKRSAGFSLVEVMIAMALVGALALVMSHLMQNSVKTSNFMETRVEEIDAINLVRLNMIDKRACGNTLGSYCQQDRKLTRLDCLAQSKTWLADGKILNPPGTKTEFDQIRGPHGNTIIGLGKYGQFLEVTKLEIENRPAADSGVPNTGGLGAVDVYVHFKRLKPLFGLPTSVKKVSVYAVVNGALPNKIERCVAAEDMDIIPKEKTYLVTKIGDANRSACGAGCWKYTAACSPGDQALSGDCLINDANAKDTKGDLDLSLPGATVCDNCPNEDPAICPPVCVLAEYTGYTCWYYGLTQPESGARILCLDRTLPP